VATGLVFVLSGPSGVGKSTLIERLKEQRFPIPYCVTATTRPRRAGERHGEHYWFLSEDDFDHLLARGEFFEHAVVHGRHRYGIPLFSAQAGLRLAQDWIMTPEVQGAGTVRRQLPEAITIFLRPASIQDLGPRLDARGTESPEDRGIRLETASREMTHATEYDYEVVNEPGRLDAAVDAVKAIIMAERLRAHPKTVRL
jgi:guanylate kinase